ncbi:hypothetical protein ACP70R_050090 [Stipagrostis hirtigluma subsp. patula]
MRKPASLPGLSARTRADRRLASCPYARPVPRRSRAPGADSAQEEFAAMAARNGVVDAAATVLGILVGGSGDPLPDGSQGGLEESTGRREGSSGGGGARPVQLGLQGDPMEIVIGESEDDAFHGWYDAAEAVEADKDEEMELASVDEVAAGLQGGQPMSFLEMLGGGNLLAAPGPLADGLNLIGSTGADDARSSSLQVDNPEPSQTNFGDVFSSSFLSDVLGVGDVDMVGGSSVAAAGNAAVAGMENVSRDQLPPEDLTAHLEAIRLGKRVAEPSDSDDSSDDDRDAFRGVASPQRRVPEILLGGMRSAGRERSNLRGLVPVRDVPQLVLDVVNGPVTVDNQNSQECCDMEVENVGMGSSVGGVQADREEVARLGQNMQVHTGAHIELVRPPQQEGRSFLASFGVDCMHRMEIPQSFVERFGDEIAQVVVFRGSTLEPFLVVIDSRNGQRVFANGWSEFAAAERISEGDVGLFQLVDSSTFFLTLFWGNGPQRVLADRPFAVRPVSRSLLGTANVHQNVMNMQLVGCNGEAALSRDADFEVGPHVRMSEVVLDAVNGIWRSYFGSRFSKLLPNVTMTVMLLFEDGANASPARLTRHSGGLSRITAGWRAFTRNFNIHVGDVFVFRFLWHGGRLRIRMFRMPGGLE